MSYLQQLLGEIEREAAEKRQQILGNAALVEIAGDVVARINAAAQRDVCFPTWHLSCEYTHPSVTIQSAADPAEEAEFIRAIQEAGFAIEQLPIRIGSRDIFSTTAVYLLIAPGVEALLRHPAQNALATRQLIAEVA